MRVGVLGAGRIGTLHAGLLVAHPRVDEVVITDAVPGRAAELAAELGAVEAPTPEAVVERCDAVVVASSTDTHGDLVKLAATHRRPTLCEKPLTPDLASTDAIVALVEDSGTPVQMGFNRRFDPGYRRAHEQVADGTVGRVLVVVGQHHDHQPPHPAYVPVSGGQYADQLIHDLDLLRFVTGQEVEKVHVAATAAGMAMFAEHGDSAVSVVTLWLDGGALATLVGTRLDPLGYDVRMEVHGTASSIAVGVDDRTPLRSVEDGGPVPSDPYVEWMARFGAAYRGQLERFLAMVAGEAPSGCTVQDARAAFAIATACTRSRDEDRVVHVGEVG